MTTPKEVEELLASAGEKAGWNRAGDPWYEADAGALVPMLVNVVREQQTEIVKLRSALIDSTDAREQQRALLGAVDSLLVDVIALVSRAGVQKDALDEMLGTRAAVHERETLPPPAPLEIASPS